MKKDEQFSEEQLNAFVDNELDPEDKSLLYSKAAKSPELDQRLCQQRKVKELVKHAYDDIPPPQRSGKKPLSRSGWFMRAIAATVLLAVGATGGLLGSQLLGESQVQVAATEQIDKYLLHVASSEPAEMRAALEYAHQLLEADESGLRQVEIVANEQGIDLLRSDVTPFAAEIAALQAEDVVFYACSKTIQRLEERGVKVELVPYTNPDYTALDRVVTRMQEGWRYEKI
jgi:intracellular sulfur oxidation DsrE/DsrF family protein